jgi:hypothetical protein
VPERQSGLAGLRSRCWGYYTELLKYKLGPTPEKRERLPEQFDGLSATATGYEDLDARIAKTRANKAELLRVLELPELPLHNNDAELGARVQARERDVSYQTRSEQGTKIKDTFMTINQTAKKLGVSLYDYVYASVAGHFKLPFGLAMRPSNSAVGVRMIDISLENDIILACALVPSPPDGSGTAFRPPATTLT